MNLFIETPQMRARRTRAEGRLPLPPGDRPASRSGQTADQVRPDRLYSVEQESYREELAFNRRRSKRRRALSVARMVGLVIAVPTGLVLLFLLAYALTCIMDGASPEELVGLMTELLEHASAVVHQAFSG